MIGKTIANLRKARGLTQSKFADEIHVTQAAVSQWETGRTNPDVQQMFILAKYFGVTVEELSNGGILREANESKEKALPSNARETVPDNHVLGRGEIATKYRQLSSKDKEIIDEMVRVLFGKAAAEKGE